MLNPSMAERIAFGRPVEETEDDVEMHLAPRPSTALIGRILLGAIFLLSGIMKLISVETTAAYMSSKGIPAATALATIAGIAEVAGGFAVIAGLLTRIGAIGLILYLIPTTLIFHDFWNLAGAEQQMQMSQFLKNLAIMGGLFLLIAHGPGRYSLDARLRGPAPV
ncbi:MAG: DoxX family protein [Myxococcales bacterium]|nr:DoxX family protein [Myxococcales bacterium]